MGKAIIGGAIGAALGAVIWLGVENSMSRSLPWLALLVGLLAGLGVRCCCGKDQRSFVTGTLAAVVTLLGVLLGPMANTYWLQLNFDRQAKPIVREDAALDEAESNEAIDAADDATEDDDADDDADDDEIDDDEIDGDDADGDEIDGDESAALPDENRSAAQSMIAAARPFLAQANGDDEDGGKSAIRAFLETNRDLIIYAASAILAYILASGATKKAAAPGPVPDAGESNE